MLLEAPSSLLLDGFPRIVVVNLPERTDRRREMEQHFGPSAPTRTIRAFAFSPPPARAKSAIGPASALAAAFKVIWKSCAKLRPTA